MKRLLVAYATKTGSTEEVAREIAKAFEGRGWSAEAKPMSGAGSLEGCDAAILGAPINGMRWLPEAEAFVESHKAALRGMGAACFYLSYIRSAGGRALWRRSIEKGMAAVGDSIGAVSVGAFGGRIAAPMPGAARFLFGIPEGSPADLRDWDAIRAWAAETAAKLGG